MKQIKKCIVCNEEFESRKVSHKICSAKCLGKYNSKKSIIEWSEDYHFDEDVDLREKDIIRQEEIQKSFSNFEFVMTRS